MQMVHNGKSAALAVSCDPKESLVNRNSIAHMRSIDVSFVHTKPDLAT